MASDSASEYDLCVIGAGTSGIASARFYLEVHPTAKVIILERDTCVGGVWSSERAYPGFRSQGGLRSGGFSDVRFEPKKEDVDDYDFYKSTAMAEYLDAYVDSHVYDGTTLRSRIRSETTVTGLQQSSAGWSISFSKARETSTISAKKVIIATGSTSVPNIPAFEGRDNFGGPIVHTLEYGRSKVYDRKDIRSVAVIGGGKSAADMVYENVKAGRAVKWIIRASGKGPGAFLDVKIKALGVKNAGEFGLIRFTASMLTLPGLQQAGWWQSFLYNTRIGSWVLAKFTKALTATFAASARYDDRPGAKETFKLLKSKMDASALQTPAGGCHHDDFWETVAHNVDVYRKDIDHLEKGKIVFADGSSTAVDAILLGTGFKDNVPFLTEAQAVQMGLPHARSAESAEEQNAWAQREQIAARRVKERFHRYTEPMSPPSSNKWGDITPTDTPFRLYSGIGPTDPALGHSIAFVGFTTITNMFASSELGAIWATAYLDGKLDLPSEEEMKQDISYITTYMKTRCPTYGLPGNWYIFDYHQLIDRWLGQIGLSSYRKGWWADHTKPLLTEDLKGLKDEYIQKYGSDTS